MIAGADLAPVVRAAVRNDPRAWERLVAEFTPTILRVARRHRLARVDQDDVVQRTWMALVRHIGHLHEPSSIGGWLATTARRESLGVIRERTREIPTENVMEHQPPQIVHDEFLPVGDERREAVRLATASMPPLQRALLSALTADPPLSYEQVSERLGIPVGSIGPTRQRVLARMRKDPRVSQLLDEYGPAHRPTRRVRPPIDLA
jgi:RNA polymerase sigma factor (sigma-70 family)